MVTDEVPREHRGLLDESWIRLGASKGGGRSGECGRSEFKKPVEADQTFSGDAEDALGDREVIRDVEVLDGCSYCASRSRIARFSSMNRLSRS